MEPTTPSSSVRPRVYYSIIAVLFVAHFLVTASLNPTQGIGMLLNTPGFCCLSGPSEIGLIGGRQDLVRQIL